MNVARWAEIRRLSEVTGLSQRAIAERLGCSWRTVRKALEQTEPPSGRQRAARASILEPYKPRIQALLTKYPELSAVRILEEIRKGPDGYRGQLSILRAYLRQIRPLRRRVYQEVCYEPAQAMQVDWGHCGQLQIGGTRRHVSVFVAVLCYSRLCYIEFALSQRKAEFYRALCNSLRFFGGTPRQIIFDNLKAAVLNGSGRHASLHPDFLALCGHYCLEPIACARRDPESKGVVEGKVRYVKHNALQGRAEELVTWNDYPPLAQYWRDQVANVRRHESTRERPVDRFQQERPLLRSLPALEFDTDEVLPAIVNSHARIHFHGNRYSVPPHVIGKTVVIRANTDKVRVIHEGSEIACHDRSYDRRQLIIATDHQLEALKLRQRVSARHIEKTFDALGPEARAFHLALCRCPVKTSVHLRRLLNLVRLYGRTEVVAAITRANEYHTYDAAYVETILLQERRRRDMPSPTEVRPKRRELLDETDFEQPDPADYDRLWQQGQEHDE